MSDTSLVAIRNMVRNITQSPQEAQLTTAQLDQYINTFVLYDFPVNVKLAGLRTTFTFYTQPNVGTYSTNTTVPTDPLYNFKNRYTAVHEPVYIAGVRASYTQNKDIFLGAYPFTNFIQNTQLLGNGTTGTFTGQLTSVPMLQNHVVFSINNTNGVAMALIDQPQANSNSLGNLYVPNDFTTIFGTINYLTGAFTMSWPSNTQMGAQLTAETIPYVTGIPTMMLYYDSKFTLYPVPDKLYVVKMEADILPTELLSMSQSPDFLGWWEYIALGACIKVFRDRMEMDSIPLIMPEFEQKQAQIARPTLDLATNNRSQTIYNNGNYGYNWTIGRWPY